MDKGPQYFEHNEKRELFFLLFEENTATCLFQPVHKPNEV